MGVVERIGEYCCYRYVSPTGMLNGWENNATDIYPLWGYLVYVEILRKKPVRAFISVAYIDIYMNTTPLGVAHPYNIFFGLMVKTVPKI